MGFKFALTQRVIIPGSEIQGLIAGRLEGIGRENQYEVKSLNTDLSIVGATFTESDLVAAQPPDMISVETSMKAIDEARDQGLRDAFEKLMATGCFKVKAERKRA